jgi:hypothetical protein
MPNAPFLALHDALAACAPKGLTRSVVTLCAQKATDRKGIAAFPSAALGRSARTAPAAPRRAGIRAAPSIT